MPESERDDDGTTDNGVHDDGAHDDGAHDDGAHDDGLPGDGAAHDGAHDDDESTGPLMVRARDVDHVFGGGRGVRDIDLDVPSGCIFGLVGPSGSGKTTMVRLILGLLRPQSGSLEVFGVAPTDFGSEQQERIGFLPQESALDPELSLRHNLQFMASLYGLPWRSRWMPGKGARAARERIQDLLELLDLGDRTRTRLRDASTGEQRRLAIAAAMVHDPDLLVLDEPTAGIDPVLREQLWDHFDGMRKSGTTLIVTTQYVTEADQCDLVGLVVDGEVLQVASPDQMRRGAFGGELVEVTHDGSLPIGDLLAVPGVVGVQRRTGPGRLLLLVEDADEVSPRLLDVLRERGHDDATVSTHRPSFDDVFVRMVRDHRDGDANRPRTALARRRGAGRAGGGGSGAGVGDRDDGGPGSHHEEVDADA